jgi:phage N-6-adenine-methyltransferase
MANDEYGTPQALVDLLNEEFGFTVDVCATPENTRVRRFFGPVGCGGGRWHKNGLFWCIAEDGLARDWHDQTFWMNPPYSHGNTEKWVQKAVHEADLGARGVGLVRADTSAQWWRRWVAAEAKEVRFTTSRIHFVGSEGAYPFPTALVVWDGRAGRGGPRYSYVDLPPEALGREPKKGLKNGEDDDS